MITRHSQTHTHIEMPAEFSPNHLTSLLYTLACTPFSPPRRTHKYMFSLRQKELQGALKLALAALSQHFKHALPTQPSAPYPFLPHHLHLHPILVFPLSICTPLFRVALPPRLLWYCRYAASSVFTASKSKSSLISISIFSSNVTHVVIDLIKLSSFHTTASVFLY